jgi:hypothetical protein
MISSAGRQFADWTAAYRLFAKERIDMGRLFGPIREEVARLLPYDLPFIAALDDTTARKCGRKVKGASWRLDPMGPKFTANFIWAQRFLQTAAILPEDGLSSRARAIPIDFVHCPSPKRPGKRASREEWNQYRTLARAMRISAQGARRIAELRRSLDASEGGRDRALLVAFDGAYTNRTVFSDIPARTTLIGRIRKDAKLFVPPPKHAVGRGRPRVYGEQIPTPEQIRADESIPWQTVKAYAAGKVHIFDVKVVRPIRWKGAGDRDLSLMVIRPLAYRRAKKSRLLYRDPAYLLCSQADLPVELVLQAYLWRWEIEVAFRDEKSLLGLGEAQVRTDPAIAGVPAFVAAMYAYLHLAAVLAGVRAPILPRPKWRRPKPDERCSTGHLIAILRTELWGKALGIFGGFDKYPDVNAKCPKIGSQAASAVIYAQK